MSLSDAVKEILWLRQLLGSIVFFCFFLTNYNLNIEFSVNAPIGSI